MGLVRVSNLSRTTPAGYGNPTWSLKHTRPKNHRDEGVQLSEEGQQESDGGLHSASRMESNIVAVYGPVGVGKARTLRDKCNIY